MVKCHPPNYPLQYYLLNHRQKHSFEPSLFVKKAFNNLTFFEKINRNSVPLTSGHAKLIAGKQQLISCRNIQTDNTFVKQKALKTEIPHVGVSEKVDKRWLIV